MARRPPPRRIRNHRLETEQFRARALLGFAVMALLLALLGAGYFRLQVLAHDEYATRSEDNRIKPRPVVPARGLIYDRAGRLLADNVPAYRLEITPEQVRDMPATLQALRGLVALDEAEVERFEAERRTTPRFRALPLKLRLSEAEVARLAVERYRLPGVEVVPYLTRHYPYGPLMAHVVGYVGRLDEDDLQALGDAKYAALSHIGKTGIERYYEERLRGEIGYEYVETNASNRALRVLRREPAQPGADLYLSIDAELQKAMVDAFEGQHGAAVAVDPRSGEVLGMASLPSYDPNLFVSGISFKDFKALNEDPARPLFNRVVLGGFAPGSTIKPFMGLAGLEYGLRTPQDTTFSSGTFYLPGQSRGYRDWKPGGHGHVNLVESLAQSVNTYYFKLAVELGIDRIDTFFERLGFGQRTGIDLVGEATGVLPSRGWKRGRLGQDWYPGDTVNIGIGQGFWVVTPLQLAQGVAMLADNGLRHRLHLLKASQTGFDAPREPEPQPAPVRVAEDAGHVDAVRAGMVAVMHGPTGSARRAAAGAPYLMAGKTGTAQRVSRRGSASLDPRKLPYHLRHQALFIGYAPAENPTIAVAVVVEHGGSGSGAAAPVARRILDAWILHGEGAHPDAVPVAQRDAGAAEAAGAAR
ncbi:penicillin-binding protein 2 [Coralloluteibacterium stylophorae]|uniref:Peptidoglycan D,D-transpeptidase MrdA n=1 Tax=Coralloluteibacterium stylophorae TaxID=1776034 RepID=A0A8J7VTK9_9GAMM|nr:penicillin-binding protein 2 [Coralloluteibacterium stylophorae]MBS7458795.1 penicillin-binding protein 2 [Coralloluteibacterium stylophorae]